MSCCDLPPVQAEYTPKGSYKTFAGLKTYTVGPEDAKVAVLVIYDIFGLSPQILQGADLIASQGHKVYMPDFLVGDYATAEFFAPGNEAKKEEWFSRFPASFSTQMEPLTKAIAAIREAGHEKVVSAGYCWGYKLTVIHGTKDIDGFVGLHPAFAAPEDADAINVPFVLLSTSGEDKSVMDSIYNAVEKKNPGKNVYNHYDDMPHGFAAARGDLSGGKATDAFADAYKRVTKFIKDTY